MDPQQSVQPGPANLTGMGLTGQPAHLPAPAPPAALTAPGPAAATADQQASTWKQIVLVLHALRRRWFLGLTVGLSLAAAAAYGAWTLIPAPYTASRDIRILTHVPGARNLGSSRGQDFKVYKQSQLKSLRSSQVLKAALQDTKVARRPLLREQEDDPIEWLQTNMQVKDGGTEFVRISLSDERRDDVIAVLDAVARAFIDHVADVDRRELKDRIDFQTREKQRAEADLEASQSGLQDFRTRLIKEHKDLRDHFAKRDNILDAIQAAKRRIDVLKQQLLQFDETAGSRSKTPAKNRQRPVRARKPGESDPRSRPQPGSGSGKHTDPEVDRAFEGYLDRNPEYRELKRTVESRERDLQTQKSELTPNHPNLKKTAEDLKKLNAELASLREKLWQEFQQRQRLSIPTAQPGVTRDKLVNELNRAQKDLTDANEQLQRNNEGLQDVHKYAAELIRREKKVADQQKLADEYKKDVRFLDHNLALQAEHPRVTLFDQRNASRPDMKKRITGTALAGFGAFGLFLAGIVLLDIRTRRISSIQQVLDRVGLPVLGSVPAMPRHATARKSGRWSARARYWHGVLTESINSARTFLLRHAGGEQTPVIMITSALGGEGKTTIACHLATSLARAGRSVLLIDGDMRRPFVHRAFGLQLEPGLADVIRGDVEPAEAIQLSDVGGLSVLSGGLGNETSMELLAQDRFGELLVDWRSHYDFIIVDSAPVLPVTDTLLIAQHTDGVLFTIRRDVSRAAKVMTACQRLSRLGVPLLGAIAIGLDDESYGYRYSYSYGYVNGPSQ